MVTIDYVETDDKKPDWMNIIDWWRRQFYIIADANAGWVAVDKAMEKIRPST